MFSPIPAESDMNQRNPAEVSLRERLVLLVGGATWIVLTGVLDYSTGVEYRIFPLYFLPICLVGWRLGYPSTLFAAWLSAATWLVSNQLGGLIYSSQMVWVVNTITQGASFTVVGVLVVVSRRAFLLAETRSRIDALTGLLSSRAFSEEATRVIALCERHHRPVTVAYIDLDHFKQVNDRFGHARGDQVLAMAASALREAARDTDLVARLGGDEFALLLPETDETGAAIVLERARASVIRAVLGEPVRVTASVGAVTSRLSHPAIDALLKQADALLYDAKERGKDCVVLKVLGP
ncbi:MAG: GGDEF domain-containing protein [Gemmatimonadetes bacterium]|nr:GGDEF domain-containing protein [Gemmatimonadota bacterium]